MKFKSQIPNLFTLSNLICGVISIYAIHQGEVAVAAYLIVLAAVFDFFDGLVARALGVAGPLGKQLDSLADAVSFGVAPVFIALHLVGILDGIAQVHAATIFLLLPVLMAAFAAYRLAVFNLDDSQSDQFIGLPTPAMALFWVAMALISQSVLSDSMLDQLYASYLNSNLAIVISALLMCLLMVVPVPLIALKFKTYAWQGNARRYILILLSIALLAIFAVKAIPIILILYIALSVLMNLRNPNYGI